MGISFKTVKKYFKKYHPNGTIWKDKNGINVTYYEDGKVYTYKCSNHRNFLNRVCNGRFDYKEDKKRYEKRLNEKLNLYHKNTTELENPWSSTKGVDTIKIDRDNLKNDIKFLQEKLEETTWL